MANQVQTKGEAVADQLTNFLNSASIKDTEDFVNAMMVEHRFLQEETFKLFLKTCSKWSEMLEADRFDDRNVFTVKTSKKITDLIENL
jgi:hypothetical protein